jgi:LacI family transcriptional regulator
VLVDIDLGNVCAFADLVKRLTIGPDSTPTRKRPTLKDLAELTGLSTAGAHYALRGERVSADTTARVRAEARRIGFRSDPVARALRGGSSGLVGVVGGSLHDYWHQHFASELGRELRRDGHQMVLADAAGDHRTQIEVATNLLDHRIDGLVVLPIDGLSPDWRDVVGRVPTVAVGAPLPPPSGSVRFGAAAGIRLMVEHLRGLGHRHVLVLTPGVHSLPASESVTVVETGFSALDATASALTALSASSRPSAVFALSDAIACGVYAACGELGLRVPDDVSVAGFDDHPLSALLHPPLTTVGWDTPRAAVTAAQILKRSFDGGAPTSVEFAPALVLRNSTGPA